MKKGNNKTRLCIEIIIFVLLLGGFLCGWFLPVKLETKPITNVLYSKQDVKSSDLQVSQVSLFGVQKPVQKYELQNVDDEHVYVRVGYLHNSYQIKKIPVSYVKADYVGKVYQYDVPSVNDFDVKVVYGNNFTKSIDDYSVEGLPDVLMDDVTVKVTSDEGSANVVVRPVEISSFDATYADDVKVGDMFDINQVTAEILFEDGIVLPVTDISTDFEGKLSRKSNVEIVSEKYGATKLELNISGASSFDVQYDGKIYEGEVVDAKKLHITAKFEDGSEELIKDITVDETEVFGATKVKAHSKAYGDLKCTITPVGIASVRADVNMTPDNVMTVNGLTFVYKDKTEKELNMEDVEIVSDISQPLASGDNEIDFKWKDHDYSFVETVMTPLLVSNDTVGTSNSDSTLTVDSTNSTDTVISNDEPEMLYITNDELEPLYVTGSEWNGSKLTKGSGVNYGPTGLETYYNLPMDDVVSIMRDMGFSESDYPYWEREDGCKMLGQYIMVAANLNMFPRGTTVECSLGTALVCDTGGFAESNPTQLDIAVNW